MRIAVISDTHGSVPRELVAKLKNADEIWHLGDVTQRETLLPIENLGRPLFVVKGNCDPYGSWPEKRLLERHGKTFALQHLPPQYPQAEVEAILYGHLHQPLDDSELGTRALNPGAVTNPRNGSVSSFAWLEIAPSGEWSWTVEAI